MIQAQQADTFGKWGEKTIARYFSQIVKYESTVLKDQDTEALHQMCVALENLCNAIALFIPALIFPPTLSEQKISKIAKPFSQLREIDTLQENLITKYQFNLSSQEEKVLKTVRKNLKQRRKEVCKKILKKFKNNTYRQFKQDLQDWLEQPQYTILGAIAIEEILPDLLSRQISQLLMNPVWLLGTTIIAGEIYLQENLDRTTVEKIITSQEETIDGLYQEIKQSYKILELFPQFYSNIYQEYLEQIYLTQQILSSLQDTLILSKFLIKTLGNKNTKKIPTITNNLQEIRYQNWQEWLKLQAVFCDYQKRQELRSILQYPRIK
jgi:CHAD domain-containing protein